MTGPREHPLELDGVEMTRWVEAAMRHIAAHVDSLGAQATSDTRGGRRLARELRQPLPQEGRPLEELLDLIFQRAVPPSFNTASPGYLAFIPGGGLLHAAVADLIAASVNRYVGVFAAAPALAQIEATVVRWLCDIVGYPPEAGGFLTSGGSLANFSAVVTARRERLPESFLEGTLYTSDQAHHSVTKAAMLAGFPQESVRTVPSDRAFRLRLDHLEEAIREDRDRGRRPFLVVANAGSTNTGAVDPLPELAELCRQEDLWLHVDAAYGGFFCLTERGRKALAGLSEADSMVLDPHKGLFMPYGSGALVVRERQALRRAHSLDAEYLPEMQQDPESVDFCQVSPELSRPFRGLQIWLPFQHLGAGPFREALDEKLDLKARVLRELEETEGVEILADSPLTVVAFAARTPGGGPAQDRRTRALLEGINRRQRVFLTPTTLNGRLAIRICILSFRTHAERVEAALEDIHSALEELGPVPQGPESPRRVTR